MTDEPDDPTGRALALLSCLTARQHWSGAELAARLGVTTRTVRRDIDRLRRLGYGIDAAAGTDGGYRLRSGVAAPPLFLDADEAVAVVTALLAAGADQTTGMVDASLRALAKLHHALPPGVQGRAEAVRHAARAAAVGRAPAVDPARVAALAEACRDGAAVRFDYVARDGRSSARRVEPSALVTVRSVWYLVAYDLDRADWRMFRVDRMQGELARSGHGVGRRRVPGGDALAFVAASLAEMPYEHTADIDLAASRDDVLAALGWLNPMRVTPLDAGSCRLHLGAADLADLARQIVDVIAVAPVLALTAPDPVRTHLASVTTTLTDALAPPDVSDRDSSRFA